MITSIQQAEDYFAHFIAKTAQITGKDITVDRMWPLLIRVGNPQEKLRVIHIAGTSGKTSTAYFIASLLHQSGAHVGLTVSPHVSSITERLQLDGHPISELEFCGLLSRFIDEIGDDPDASYFELLIVFIFWAFVESNVDYAVVETGLGGLHDSTNVCRRKDKICVITDIGMDHQHVLGNTIAAIAEQKAGIIHEDNIVFSYLQNGEIMEQINDQVIKTNTKLHTVTSGLIATKSQLAIFQQKNWHLAKTVYEYIAQRDGLSYLTSAQLQASQVQVPGRIQEITANNKTYVLDGAHNEQKVAAFLNSFIAKYSDKRVPILLGMKEGKEYIKVIELLQPIASEIICVGFSTRQDTPIHSIDPQMLAEECRRAGITRVTIADSLEDGLRILTDTKNGTCIITGSFYLLGSTIELLK